MQIVSPGDNLHATSKPSFWGNCENIILSSAEFAHRLIKVNDTAPEMLV